MNMLETHCARAGLASIVVACTQMMMDERCRILAPHVLPFMITDSVRILAICMVFSSVFPVQLFVFPIYVLVQIFVSRSNMLGRFEPGAPTKPLLYRIAFSVYLPLHMILRFIYVFQVRNTRITRIHNTVSVTPAFACIGVHGCSAGAS